MKRWFWFSQLVFTGLGFLFFFLVHLSILVRLRFPDSLWIGGLVAFGVGLFPMWMVTCLNIAFMKREGRKDWLSDWLSEWPNPRLVKMWFKIFWIYAWTFSVCFIAMPDTWGFWGHFLRALGIPCFFMGFYGPGVLCAWANWRRADRIDPSQA